MESTEKQIALARLLGALRAGWRITLLMAKVAFQKRRNLNLVAYQEEVFFHWIWRWKWRWNFVQGRWTVNQLRAYCPVCQSKLKTLDTNYLSVLICPKGGSNHGELFTYRQDVATTVKSLLLAKATSQFNLSER